MSFFTAVTNRMIHHSSMDGDNRMIEGWDKILIEEIGVE